MEKAKEVRRGQEESGKVDIRAVVHHSTKTWADLQAVYIAKNIKGDRFFSLEPMTEKLTAEQSITTSTLTCHL